MRVGEFMKPIVRTGRRHPIGAWMIPGLGIGPAAALGKFLGGPLVPLTRVKPARDHACSIPERETSPMPPPSDQAASKSEELKAFVFFTFVVAPAMAGVIVGTYGLVVWIYQMFAGPPTG